MGSKKERGFSVWAPINGGFNEWGPINRRGFIMQQITSCLGSSAVSCSWARPKTTGGAQRQSAHGPLPPGTRSMTRCHPHLTPSGHSRHVAGIVGGGTGRTGSEEEWDGSGRRSSGLGPRPELQHGMPYHPKDQGGQGLLTANATNGPSHDSGGPRPGGCRERGYGEELTEACEHPPGPGPASHHPDDVPTVGGP